MAKAAGRKEIVIVLAFGDRPTGLESNLSSDSTNIRLLANYSKGKQIEAVANRREHMKQEDNYDRDANIVNPFEDTQYEYSNDDESDSNSSCDGDLEDHVWERPTIVPRNYLSQEENAICSKMWQLVDRLEEKARSTPSVLTPDLFNAWRQFEGAILGIPPYQIEEYRPLCPDSSNHYGCGDDPTEPLLGMVPVRTPEIASPGNSPSNFAQTAADMSWMNFV